MRCVIQEGEGGKSTVYYAKGWKRRIIGRGETFIKQPEV